MNKEQKLKVINDTLRDINRDILGFKRKLEDTDAIEKMNNPAETQKQYKEAIDELEARIVVINEVKKDIEDLYTMRRILQVVDKKPENEG